MAGNSIENSVRFVLAWVIWPIRFPFSVIGAALFLLAGLFGIRAQTRSLYAHTIGWVKMKLGYWQLISHKKSSIGKQNGFGEPPSWVKSAVKQKLGKGPNADETIELSGQSFYYRVECRAVARQSFEYKYYRKLKAPLFKRCLRTVIPRWPRTYAEALIKIALITGVVYIFL
jgi:hypothetical protein